MPSVARGAAARVARGSAAHGSLGGHYRHNRDHHHHDYYGPRHRHSHWGFYAGFGFGSLCYPYYYGGYPSYGFYHCRSYPWYWSWRGRYGYRHSYFHNGFYLGYGVYRPVYWSPFWGVGLNSYYVEPVYVESNLGYPYNVEVVVVEKDADETLPPEEAPPENVAPQRVLGPNGIEEVDPGAGVMAPTPGNAEEEFLASLEPAQLSFAVGLMHVREGRFQYSTEAFYNATVQAPDNRLYKVFLAQSLVTIAEYEYAAEFLRLALDRWDEFPRYRWSIEPLFESPAALVAQLAQLEAEVRMHPQDPDRALVLGYMRFVTGDEAGAAASFDAVRSLAEREDSQRVASAFIREIEARNGTYPRSPAEGLPPADDTAEFLADFELARLR